MIPYIADCDALLIEANHDEQLLQNGRYPVFLKRRIAGDKGHLANSQTAQLLRHVDQTRLRRVVAAHLSKENNRPELAQQALAQALGRAPGDIDVALQLTGSPWVQVG